MGSYKSFKTGLFSKLYGFSPHGTNYTIAFLSNQYEISGKEIRDHLRDWFREKLLSLKNSGITLEEWEQRRPNDDFFFWPLGNPQFFVGLTSRGEDLAAGLQKRAISAVIPASQSQPKVPVVSNERAKTEVAQPKQRESSPIPKYLVHLLTKILSDQNRSVGIGDLMGRAVAIRGEIPVEFVEKRLYVLSKREDSPFFVAEYPGFKLRSVSKLPDFSKVSTGLRYVSYASKVLISSKEYINVREIVSKIEERKLYKFPTETPEYWMCVHLSEHKKFFVQRGTLTIGLKRWRQEKVPVESENSRKLPTEKRPSLDPADNQHVTRNIHEANLESVVIEQLDKIEEGLQLIERQRICPGIGRIDVLCRDRYGDLVIVELKSFMGKQDSIVDQIGRYMGYVRSYLAKSGQSVRGIILVAKADERLRHAVAGFPNLELKEFDLSIK